MNNLKLIFTAILFLALTCACSNDDVIKGEIAARKLVYAFTDTPGSVSNSETMTVSSSEQEFSLSVKSLMETGFQIPDKLFLSVSEWDNEKRLETCFIRKYVASKRIILPCIHRKCRRESHHKSKA